MKSHLILAAAIILTCHIAHGAEPIIDVYVSTEDIHFLGAD